MNFDRGTLIFIAGSLLGAAGFDRILVRKLRRQGKVQADSAYGFVTNIIVGTEMYEATLPEPKGEEDDDAGPGIYL